MGEDLDHVESGSLKGNSQNKGLCSPSVWSTIAIVGLVAVCRAIIEVTLCSMGRRRTVQGTQRVHADHPKSNWFESGCW